MECAALQSRPAASRMMTAVGDEECWGEPVSGRGSAFDGCSASSTCSSSSSSSLGSDSSFGRSASSSLDFMDDATSPSDRPSPLYEMATLRTDLPIKSGLSQYFQGKSQSFASLSAITTVEDLAKPDRQLWLRRFSKRRGTVVTACKSQGFTAGLEKGHAAPISPNGRVISKPKRHCSCLAGRNLAGGGGGRGFCGNTAAGLLPSILDHYQKHGAAAGGCLRRYHLFA